MSTVDASTVDIDALIAGVKRPEREVDVCLNADLTAQHDRLTRQLAEARRAAPATMAGATAGVDIAERIRALEEQMRASTRTFRMRGLSSPERHQWEAAHPAEKGSGHRFNMATAPPALIAASCVAIYPAGADAADHPSAEAPVLTVAQATALCERLGHGQTDLLFGAAWEATNGDGAVPFSATASALLGTPSGS